MEQNKICNFINKVNFAIKNLIDSLNDVASTISTIINVILESKLLTESTTLNNTEEYMYINILHKNCYFERMIE